MRDEGDSRPVCEVCSTSHSRVWVHSEAKTTGRVPSFTRVRSSLSHVLHTIVFVTVHAMYDLRRLWTGAECKFSSMCACVTGSFIFPFKMRMRNRIFIFPLNVCIRNSTFHVLFWILSLCVCVRHTWVELRTFRVRVTKKYYCSQILSIWNILCYVGKFLRSFSSSHNSTMSSIH